MLPCLTRANSGKFGLHASTSSSAFSQLSEFHRAPLAGLKTAWDLHCPDVCPVTLGYLTALMRNLGEQKSQVQVLFVSVDPKYDTIEHLDKYLIYFDQSIVGLTGTQQEVDIVADSFKLRRASVADLEVSTEYRKKKFSKDGVNKAEDKTKIFSHSTYIYLLDKQGRTRTFFDTGTSRDKVKQQIASLLAE